MYYMEWDRRTASAGAASKCSNPDMAVQEGTEATGEVLRCHPGITLTDVTKVSVRLWLGDTNKEPSRRPCPSGDFPELSEEFRLNTTDSGPASALSDTLQFMNRELQQVLKRRFVREVDRVAAYVGVPLSNRLADAIAYRIAFETIRSNAAIGRRPNELFSGVGDNFWFWLCTEGYRREPFVRNILPAMPDEEVQMNFTGDTGDSVLRDGFFAYLLFRELYQRHVGPIDQCAGILDFGCGWGRIIRFFLKDVEPSRLWGVDPVEEMIRICTRDNNWCNFVLIDPAPPSPFKDSTFDLIYSYSVFSHLSEDMHQACLAELVRILTPGGLLIATTRPREFIKFCGDLRKSRKLDAIHPAIRSSASTFIDQERAMATYDNGGYCFSPLEGVWSYWGEAAISLDYARTNWSRHLTFIDYIDDRKQCDQNVIVMRKPA